MGKEVHVSSLVPRPQWSGHETSLDHAPNEIHDAKVTSGFRQAGRREDHRK